MVVSTYIESHVPKSVGRLISTYNSIDCRYVHQYNADTLDALTNVLA